MEQSRKSLDEQFTDFADTVSEAMGKWWVTMTSVVAILIWLATGPLFHYSDTWQLMVNTPTTIIEMWIGFLLAAAANRVEKRNKILQDNQARILSHIEKVTDAEGQEILKEEAESGRLLEIIQAQEQRELVFLDKINLLLERTGGSDGKGETHVG